MQGIPRHGGRGTRREGERTGKGGKEVEGRGGKIDCSRGENQYDRDRFKNRIPGWLGGGNMQRWEYMIRKTDLKALNQSSMLDLEQVRLTEYGEDGWEMVSAVPSQESLIIFLKRPVEGQ
jgi:hypothetical protein